MLRAFLQSWLGDHRAAGTPPHRRSTRLTVEPLEARELPAVSPVPLAPVGTRVGSESLVRSALQGKQVQAVYHHYLHRAATQSEITQGLHLIRGGATDPLESKLASGDEYFRKRAGGKTNKFLAAVAKDLLGHPLDALLTQQYRAMLRGGTARRAVVSLLLLLRATERAQPRTGVLQPPGGGSSGSSEPAFFRLDPTVATTTASASLFLYTGPDAVQTGVADDVIDPVRTAILRGRVLDRNSNPLSGVGITVLGHPEFGSTKTQSDGWFSLAVNGGGPLTVVYSANGFLPVQRTATVPWQDYTVLDNVTLVPLDSQVTTIDLNSSAATQVAQGSAVTDGDGTRQNTLLIDQGTHATMTLADGTTQPLDTLHVRVTEYTVGASGVTAMPGALPASSGYTYAVELSMDEALAAGATSVNFDHPLYDYVDNFLDFPVGTAVPAGYYDRTRGAWVASDNGKVIKILGQTGGLADIDADGDGNADTPTQLAGLGFTDGERQELATLYTAGQTLWRVPITHFTPWDYNWPYGLPDGAGNPNCPTPDNPQGCGCNCTTLPGSIISPETQALGEQVGITGTPFALAYDTSRSPGRTDYDTIEVTLSTDTVPAALKRIDLEVDVAGQRFTQSFSAAPDQTYDFVWNGLDAFGRVVQGAQKALVKIGYVYDAVYQNPAQFQQSFGALSGTPITADRARQEITLSQAFEEVVGNLNAESLELGGWDLDVHNVYDPTSQTLYFGNGGKETILVPGFNSVVSTIAGAGYTGDSGDGVPATQAQLFNPVGVRYGPDGSLYVSDFGSQRIRKVDTRGIITTIAGTGTSGFSGDGGPATQARLSGPASLDVGPDGSIYFYDADNNRVRRVAPDGTIATVAGTGTSGFSGDGGPATQAKIASVCFIRVGPDGGLYILEPNDQRIRKVDTNGIIHTVAGTGAGGFAGDGGPATQAQLNFPTGMAFGPDGSMYIADGLNGRIRKVGTDGIITTYAGGGNPASGNGDGGPALQAKFEFFQGFSVGVDIDAGRDGSLYVTEKGRGTVRRIGPDGIVTTVAGVAGASGFSGDGGPATAATFNTPDFLTVTPDGSLLINDQGNRRLRRVAPPLPGFNASDIALPSPDGSQVYQFDAQGRHLRTIDALTNVALYTFGYDAAGRLIRVTDQDGNVTRIERDASGKPTAIVAPFGQRTSLTLDTNGRLSRITDPAGGTVKIGYTTSGLLDSFTDVLGATSHMTYDARGLLIKDENALGGFTSLDRTENGDIHTVTVKTAEGRVTSYAMTELGAGGRREVFTADDGTQTVTVTAPDGTQTVTTPDGTVTTTKFGPDPRFGMLSSVVVSSTVRTPGGLTSTMTESRTMTLSDPANPLSLTHLDETETLNGQVFTTTFDAGARTVTTTSAEGRSSVITLDALGHVVRAEAPGMLPVVYTYDPHGRIKTVTQGDRSSSFEYGTDGLLARYTDPLNEKVQFQRDAVGRVLKQTLADGRQISLDYDLAGGLASLTPSGQPAHTFGYNLLGKATSYTPPTVSGTGPVTQRYNLDQELTKVARADGTTIDFSYDTAGRLQTMTTAAGQTQFSYDATTGLLQTLTAPGSVSLAFTYDGSLLTGQAWSGPVTGSVTDTIDNNYRVTSESVDGANTVNFQYDDDGLLISAGDLSLTRDPQNGRVTNVTLADVDESFGYDEFSAVTSHTASFSGNTLLSQADTMDALGRITHRVETVDGVTHTYDYGYDPTGRLAQVKTDDVVTAKYEYDSNDNRLSVMRGAATVNGSYDDQDRLTQYGNTSYTYTADGELVSKSDASGTTSYDYDAQGNLRRVTLSDGRQIDYVIDGAGRRIGKKVDGALVQGWLYDTAGRIVAELDGAGNVVSRFVYATGVNVPDTMIRSGVEYRLIRDQVGSVRLVVNAATGEVAQRIDYDEFGRVLSDTNAGFQPFGFAGGLYDRDTGLVRFGARDYDAETGRWTAKDPIGFMGGQTNLYLYVGNDPVNAIDPGGCRTVVLFDVSEPLFLQQAQAISGDTVLYSIHDPGDISGALRDLQNRGVDITDLVILGHSDWNEQLINGQPLQPSDIPNLASSGAHSLTLGGCGLGRNPDYLKKFAKAAGVPTRAFNHRVVPDTFRKDEVYATSPGLGRVIEMGEVLKNWQNGFSGRNDFTTVKP